MYVYVHLCMYLYVCDIKYYHVCTSSRLLIHYFPL